MKKRFLCLIMCLLSACGTLISGSSQTVSIDSNVEEAEIYEGGVLLCETPCSTQMKRARGEKTLIVKKAGYEDARVMLGSSVNIVSLLNVFSLVGFITDAATGAVWEYSPNNYYVNLMRDKKARRTEELKQREIRRFTLANWDALKKEAKSHKNGEYIKGLSELTKLSPKDLMRIIGENVSPVLGVESIIEESEF